jgi:hypothetical protein
LHVDEHPSWSIVLLSSHYYMPLLKLSPHFVEQDPLEKGFIQPSQEQFWSHV